MNTDQTTQAKSSAEYMQSAQELRQVANDLSWKDYETSEEYWGYRQSLFLESSIYAQLANAAALRELNETQKVHTALTLAVIKGARESAPQPAAPDVNAELLIACKKGYDELCTLAAAMGEICPPVTVSVLNLMELALARAAQKGQR